jgi:hypothetical protein
VRREAAGAEPLRTERALGIADGQHDPLEALVGERLDRRERDLRVAAEDDGGPDAA